jgi:hypothetical protein
VSARQIEDACLSSWRDATVEVGLLTEATTGGVTVFHGCLKYHDDDSVFLAPDRGLGPVLISRRAIAYIRPRTRPRGTQ